MKLGILDRLRRRSPDADEQNTELDSILEDSMKPGIVGEVYPDDAAALVENARERVLRNSHFFSDTWFRTNTLDPAQKDIICDFLHDLSQVVMTRGVMLTSEVIDHLSMMLRTGETELAHWQEPWMVPYKITRRRAVDLFEHCLAQTSRIVAFERLAECGMKAKWAKSYAELGDRLRADSMDGASLMKVFHTTLIRVARQDDRSDVRSVCYTMDYALACIGDRAAMMRVSETLRRVCVPEGDDDESRLLTAARSDELALVADSWRRMSSIVRSRPMGDGERELAEMIAPLKMDMRRLDSYFEDKPGWVLPPSNVVPLPSAPPSAGDWRVTLFEPVQGQADRPVQRPAASFDATRQACILDLFLSEDTGKVLAQKASDDAPWDIDDAHLQTIHEFIEKERGKRKGVSEVELVAASYGAAIQRNKPNSLSLLEVMRTLEYGSGTIPVREKRVEVSVPTMKVLDRIGPSEDSNKGSAEVTFARLLAPFEVRASRVDADKAYAVLCSEFPWMRDANEMVAKAVAFAERTRTKAFRMKPLLLNGIPGIGKTRWIRRVAEVTGIPSHVTNLSGVNTTKAIIGSERGWASARPSLPAYAFLSTDVANPIIYADEIDKSSRWEDIADAFLPMIEKETYCSYADIYLLGNMDLSAATFMFSANDLSKVSQAFLSRVTPIHVRAPNEREIGGVIASMVNEIGEESLLDIFEMAEMSEKLMGRSTEIYLRTTNLREVRKFITNEIENTLWKPPGPRLVE
ncbi:AAA family ATPase [Agrobacterium rubi]|nr:AAA family ATPase [Agrobacterium rubi]NTF24568.1 AAA family ATPase [Agrobacterium rubi]